MKPFMTSSAMESKVVAAWRYESCQGSWERHPDRLKLLCSACQWPQLKGATPGMGGVANFRIILERSGKNALILFESGATISPSIAIQEPKAGQE